MTTGKAKASNRISRKVAGALEACGVRRRFPKFADAIASAKKYREELSARWQSQLDPNDIITFINGAIAGGDMDEAVWRAFLAAHFGRDTAEGKQKVARTSAGKLLCEFGDQPVWTWKSLQNDRSRFYGWLNNAADELRTLRFGNHRKFESNSPEHLQRVLDCFVELVHDEYGDSPARLLKTDLETTREARFDTLFCRLKRVHRFGRTACFDFVAFLADSKLVDAEPGSCYLKGARGPLEGARKLWRHRPIVQLDQLAASLCKRLGFSPLIVEDALCNWQKKV